MSSAQNLPQKTSIPVSVVILAAGEGKRMKSAKPKVLQIVGGKTMLARVVDVAQSLKPARTCVVYGHMGDTVRASLLNIT